MSVRSRSLDLVSVTNRLGFTNDTGRRLIDLPHGTDALTIMGQIVNDRKRKFSSVEDEDLTYQNKSHHLTDIDLRNHATGASLIPRQIQQE
jgi:hypothetical protein